MCGYLEVTEGGRIASWIDTQGNLAQPRSWDTAPVLRERVVYRDPLTGDELNTLRDYFEDKYRRI